MKTHEYPGAHLLSHIFQVSEYWSDYLIVGLCRGKQAQGILE